MAEVVHVLAHLAPRGYCKPSSCATFMLNSHWGRAATGKKTSVSMHTGSLRLCQTLCDPVDCGLPAFSVRHRSSLGKNTGTYWPMLLLLLLSRFSRVRLCDPIDDSPPGSSVPVILQARILEWVAIPFSRDQTQLSCVTGRYFTI